MMTAASVRGVLCYTRRDMVVSKKWTRNVGVSRKKVVPARSRSSGTGGGESRSFFTCQPWHQSNEHVLSSNAQLVLRI